MQLVATGQQGAAGSLDRSAPDAVAGLDAAAMVAELDPQQIEQLAVGAAGEAGIGQHPQAHSALMQLSQGVGQILG